MKRLIVMLAATALLSGCGGGVEWMPEYKPAEASTTADTTPVGSFLTAFRTGAGAATVVTTKGVFNTYTSLGVPVHTPVSMVKYTDPVSKLLVGKVLQANGRTILIKDVVSLNQ